MKLTLGRGGGGGGEGRHCKTFKENHSVAKVLVRFLILLDYTEILQWHASIWHTKSACILTKINEQFTHYRKFSYVDLLTFFKLHKV